MTVHSMGGLGNQLFIYAAGLAVATASGSRLRIDIGQHRARADRPPELEALGFPAEFVDLGVHTEPPWVRRRAARWITPSPHAPWGCSFRERGFRYEPAVLRQPAGSCLFGYFQSWRYVRHVDSRLRELFAAVAADRADVLEPLLPVVSSHPRTVVLHVRRGDYLLPEADGYHGLAGLRFYGRALAVLRSMGFDGPVVLVSDDLPAARAELGDLGDLLDLDGAATSLDEMLIMSRAPALVTANSSFSWWAGWLGDRPGRPVVAPRPWFDDPAIDSRDLLPSDWLTLDRRDG